MTFIPKEQYNEILQLLPICCVDVIILHDRKVLVIKRGQFETYGGLWWVPGGRVYKGENWDVAVRRKALEETGLKVKISRQLQSYEAPEAEGKHFITTLFVTSVIGDVTVKLDNTSVDYRWADSMSHRWDSLLQQMLRDAEVFNV